MRKAAEIGMAEEEVVRAAPPRGGRALRITWLVIEHLFNRALDALGEYIRIILREAELFLGTGLVLLGLLNFQNGKNCDGNTADYLSCTRPSTFYYFNGIEIALIIIGVFLLILWYFKRRERLLAQERFA